MAELSVVLLSSVFASQVSYILFFFFPSFFPSFLHCVKLVYSSL